MLYSGLFFNQKGTDAFLLLEKKICEILENNITQPEAAQIIFKGIQIVEMNFYWKIGRKDETERYKEAK